MSFTAAKQKRINANFRHVNMWDCTVWEGNGQLFCTDFTENIRRYKILDFFRKFELVFILEAFGSNEMDAILAHTSRT